MPFTAIDDFGLDSYSPVCPVSGLAKQKFKLGKQDHEVDDLIVRGPEIFAPGRDGNFSIGYFDFRSGVLQEAARELLGMLSKAEGEALRAEIRDLRGLREAQSGEVESLRAQVRALTLQNAEQVVQIEALIVEGEELYAATLGDPEYDDVLDRPHLSLDALRDAEYAEDPS